MALLTIRRAAIAARELYWGKPTLFSILPIVFLAICSPVLWYTAKARRSIDQPSSSLACRIRKPSLPNPFFVHNCACCTGISDVVAIEIPRLS